MIQYQMVAMTDVGVKRTHNEDCVAASPENGFAILADGMGGYNAGEVASAMAVDIIGQQLRDKLAESQPDQINSQTGFTNQSVLTRQAIVEANASIYHTAQCKAECAGMGTTILVAVLHDNLITAAHVGDSRMYRLRDHALSHVTEDHSLVHEQVRRGLLSAHDARNSSIKNLVTRALGVDKGVEPELVEDMVKSGDIYLMSSDGLTDVVSDETIARVLRDQQTDLKRAAELLIEMANQAGGPDNISVILIKAYDGNRGQGFLARLFQKA